MTPTTPTEPTVILTWDGNVAEVSYTIGEDMVKIEDLSKGFQIVTGVESGTVVSVAATAKDWYKVTAGTGTVTVGEENAVEIRTSLVDTPAEAGVTNLVGVSVADAKKWAEKYVLTPTDINACDFAMEAFLMNINLSDKPELNIVGSEKIEGGFLIICTASAGESPIDLSDIKGTIGVKCANTLTELENASIKDYKFEVCDDGKVRITCAGEESLLCKAVVYSGDTCIESPKMIVRIVTACSGDGTVWTDKIMALAGDTVKLFISRDDTHKLTSLKLVDTNGMEIVEVGDWSDVGELEFTQGSDLDDDQAELSAYIEENDLRYDNYYLKTEFTVPEYNEDAENPNWPFTVQVVFEELPEPEQTTFKLTIPEVTGVTAAVTADGETVADLEAILAGKEVTVTWTASAGYVITAGGTETFTMDEDKTAAAPTVVPSYVLTLKWDAGIETVSYMIEGQTTEVTGEQGEDGSSTAIINLASGTEVKVTATAQEGYKVTAGIGDVTVTENKTVEIKAQKITYAQVTIVPIDNCTIVVKNGDDIIVSGSKFDVDDGIELTVTRAAAEGYELDDCTAEETVTMTQDRTITAAVKAKVVPKSYPSYVEGNEELKAKYDAWAQEYGEDTQSAYEEAFLLNVDPNAEETEVAKRGFVINSIEFDENGVATAFTVGSGNYNGTVMLKGCDTYDGTYQPALNTKAYKFYKACMGSVMSPVNVRIMINCAGGKLLSDKVTAHNGETVKLLLSHDVGHTFAKLQLVDADGNELVKVGTNGDGEEIFVPLVEDWQKISESDFVVGENLDVVDYEAYLTGWGVDEEEWGNLFYEAKFSVPDVSRMEGGWFEVQAEFEQKPTTLTLKWDDNLNSVSYTINDETTDVADLNTGKVTVEIEPGTVVSVDAKAKDWYKVASGTGAVTVDEEKTVEITTALVGSLSEVGIEHFGDVSVAEVKEWADEKELTSAEIAACDFAMDAYLMNCDLSAEPKLAIVGGKEVDGGVAITIKGTAGEAAIDLGNLNGVLKIKRAATLADLQNAEPVAYDIDVRDDGCVVKVADSAKIYYFYQVVVDDPPAVGSVESDVVPRIVINCFVDGHAVTDKSMAHAVLADNAVAPIGGNVQLLISRDIVHELTGLKLVDADGKELTKTEEIHDAEEIHDEETDCLEYVTNPIVEDWNFQDCTIEELMESDEWNITEDERGNLFQLTSFMVQTQDQVPDSAFTVKAEFKRLQTLVPSDGEYSLSVTQAVDEAVATNMAIKAIKIPQGVEGVNAKAYQSCFMAVAKQKTGEDGWDVTVELDPDVVTPEITEIESLGITEGTLSFEAKPGLYYHAVRGTTLENITTPVDVAIAATNDVMTIQDKNPPANQAFYRIVVTAEKPSEPSDQSL